MFHATGTLYKAAGVLLEGRPNEALPLLTRGLEAYRATGAGLALPYYLSILGDAYIQAGRPDDARDVLDEGLAIAERSDELCQKAELLPPQRRTCVADRVTKWGGRRTLSSSDRNGAAPAKQSLGAPSDDKSGAPLPTTGSARRSAPNALRHIWLVHRGFDTPDLKCRQGAVG